MLVWSDATWDGSAGLGFVIFVPADEEGGRARILYAAARPDSTTIGFFMRKAQYIGQLELLAAVCCYYSFPDIFRDREVIHFIDNTSALAALIKGYSGLPDSARIVHAFWSLNPRLTSPRLVSVCRDEGQRGGSSVSWGPARDAGHPSHL